MKGGKRMNRYENLEVWKKSHELTLKIYEVTKSFPTDERYALTDQMRRCSYSIPMNIAEGAGYQSKKNFQRFLDVSKGSAFELDYQLRLVKDLDYIDKPTYLKLKEETVTIQKDAL